jgi:hypothetical protein
MLKIHHWRLLQDGRVFLGLSSIIDDSLQASPADGSMIRADVEGGYIMSPVGCSNSSGTNVEERPRTFLQYIVKVCDNCYCLRRAVFLLVFFSEFSICFLPFCIGRIMHRFAFSLT